MNSVVHFEVPYEDGDRVSTFYENAFGWRMQHMGAEMRDYITAETTVTENGRPSTPGAINGGFWNVNQSDANTPRQPSFVIAVEDIYDAIAAVKAANGTILGEPMDIPGVGMYVQFKDTEGNQLSILQPAPRV